MKIVRNYINGSLEGSSNEYLPIFDPSTGEEISKVALSNKEDFDNVIQSSANAFDEWSNFTPLKRSRNYELKLIF